MDFDFSKFDIPPVTAEDWKQVKICAKLPITSGRAEIIDLEEKMDTDAS